jgi:hypothetical protein
MPEALDDPLYYNISQMVCARKADGQSVGEGVIRGQLLLDADWSGDMVNGVDERKARDRKEYVSD